MEDIIFGFVLIAAGVGGACILVAVGAALVLFFRLIYAACCGH